MEDSEKCTVKNNFSPSKPVRVVIYGTSEPRNVIEHYVGKPKPFVVTKLKCAKCVAEETPIGSLVPIL